jgi:hypothetical protein
MPQTLFVNGEPSATLNATIVDWTGLGATYNTPEVVSMLTGGMATYRDFDKTTHSTPNPLAVALRSREVTTNGFVWSLQDTKYFAPQTGGGVTGWAEGVSRKGFIITRRALNGGAISYQAVVPVTGANTAISLAALPLIVSVP